MIERVEDAGDFLIGKEAGKGEAAVIINGHMEAFDSSATIAESAIPGGADSGVREAAQLLDVEVKEFTGMIVFVALDRRFWRFQGTESIEVMATQHAGERGFGNRQDHEDLGIGAALATQGKDLSFELRAGLAWLAVRNGGMIFEARREAGGFGP